MTMKMSGKVCCIPHNNPTSSCWKSKSFLSSLFIIVIMKSTGRIVNPYLSRKKKTASSPKNEASPKTVPTSSSSSFGRKPLSSVAAKKLPGTTATRQVGGGGTSQTPATSKTSSNTQSACRTTTPAVVSAIKPTRPTSSPLGQGEVSKMTLQPQQQQSQQQQPQIANRKFPLTTAPTASSSAKTMTTKLSLKQKLKQDIENLKRAKLLQKQKIEEQKRRREMEKEAARRKRQQQEQQQQQQRLLEVPTVAVHPQPENNSSPLAHTLTSSQAPAAIVSAKKLALYHNNNNTAPHLDGGDTPAVATATTLPLKPALAKVAEQEVLSECKSSVLELAVNSNNKQSWLESPTVAQTSSTMEANVATAVVSTANMPIVQESQPTSVSTAGGTTSVVTTMTPQAPVAWKDADLPIGIAAAPPRIQQKNDPPLPTMSLSNPATPTGTAAFSGKYCSSPPKTSPVTSASPLRAWSTPGKSLSCSLAETSEEKPGGSISVSVALGLEEKLSYARKEEKVDAMPTPSSNKSNSNDEWFSTTLLPSPATDIPDIPATTPSPPPLQPLQMQQRSLESQCPPHESITTATSLQEEHTGPVEPPTTPAVAYQQQSPQIVYPPIAPKNPTPVAYPPTAPNPSVYANPHMVYPHAAAGAWNNPWQSYYGMSNPNVQQHASYPLTMHPYPFANSFGFSMGGINPVYQQQTLGYTSHGHAPMTAASQQPHASATTLYSRTPVQRPPKPVEPAKLAKVLEAPSPFAATFELVAEPIVLLKDKPESSFGISVGVYSESGLVEPEWLERQNGVLLDKSKNVANDTPPSNAPNTKAVDAAPGKVLSFDALPPDGTISPGGGHREVVAVTKVRRPRRRRHVFRVMIVSDASTQNQRGSDRTHLLQKGDIVIEIGGQSIAGYTFAEACQLFKTAKGNTDADGWIRSRILVARRRPPPPPKIPAPLPKLDLAVLTKARSITPSDISEWASLRLKWMFNKKRLLGIAPTESDLGDIHAMSESVANLSATSLEEAWQRLARDMQRSMNSKALQHWKTEWQKETPEIRDASGRTYLSDAQRSRMRGVARPSNACKCGSKAHLLVNDPLCPLYSNLRKLENLEVESMQTGTRVNVKKMKFQERKLKTVEAAFTERITREKAEKDGDEAEASFVDRAEEVQLRLLQQAVFTPSLTAMLLSCVTALKQDFEEVRQRKSKLAERRPIADRQTDRQPNEAIHQMRDKDTIVEEDEDDDEVPLTELGKRALPAPEPAGPSKKAKTDTTRIDYECLARIFKYISNKWGHLYREPEDVDYAWRWEITGTSSQETSAKNPRRPGSLSLENIRFVIDEKLIDQLQFGEEPQNADQIEAVKILSFVSDASRTGIVDELCLLYGSGVLRIDAFGVPRLSSSWYQNIDVLLLEEMRACWDFEIDRLGRYGIQDSVRKTLASKWIRHDEGWALTSEPEEIIFDVDEFEMWRSAFETKHEEQHDDMHGVGRFF